MNEDAPTTVAHEPTTYRGLAEHYLKDLVYGANDGIITTFAIVAGVTGAQLEPRIVLILGFANLFADGFSMGTSNFLSIRSDEAVRAASGLGVSEPYPGRHSVATFLAFVVAGLVPLLSFVIVPAGNNFAWAVGLTLGTLFVVGAARSFVTPAPWWRNGSEMLAIGSVAAAVSYGIGALVEGMTR